MKPDEALYHLENHGGMGVPRLYSEMPRGLLQRLVDECARPSASERSEAGLKAWSQKRLKQTDWQGIAERKKSGDEDEATPCVVEPRPEEPTTLAYRAILKPERLSTPRRRQAAFIGHFARCRSIPEAAARTGVDRRTVQRWRKTSSPFDRKCRDIVEARRRQAVENIVLAADQGEVRPVFYRGRKIGEYTKRDRALDLYLLKQADAARQQEERRAAQQEEEKQKARQEEERRAAEAAFEARVAAAVEQEVARRISERSRSPRHEAVPADDDFTNVFREFDPEACDMGLAR